MVIKLSLLNHYVTAHALWHHSKQGIPRNIRWQTKMKMYLELSYLTRIAKVGAISELLITSIAWHKNKNRWVGDPLWRSRSLFCVGIFHSSFGLMKYPSTKQFTWSPQGILPSSVLVICWFSFCPYDQILGAGFNGQAIIILMWIWYQFQFPHICSTLCLWRYGGGGS